MTVDLGVGLAVALLALLGLAVAASRLGRLRMARAQVVAAVRAAAQLAAVSVIIAAAVAHVATALAFAAFMFAVAVFTTARRVGTGRAWPWTALAMAAGTAPVLATVHVSGAAPFTGVTIVALSGIVIGNTMTAHTLLGQRAFAELRAHRGTYEAGLALGLVRRDAIDLVIEPLLPDALVPNLDQTRTVGLVALPGAFIGVLLGGGSPLQAGAAQVLVLVGVMAGQALTVATAAELIRRARLLPKDLTAALHP